MYGQVEKIAFVSNAWVKSIWDDAQKAQVKMKTTSEVHCTRKATFKKVAL